MRKKFKFSTAVIHVLIILAVFLAMYPIFVMVAGSFKSAQELNYNVAGFPKAFTFENYTRLLNYNSGIILRTYLNSILVASCYTLLTLTVTSLAGFAFAKYRFRGRDPLFVLLLITMMVPMELNMTPLYLIFSKLKWLNTYQVQIIPGVANVFALFMMRQHMHSIPDVLLDAGRIDGAGEFRIFRDIVLPVSKPALGALAILQFLSKWNDFLYPKIMITKAKLMPIMVILPTLNEIDSARSVPWELVLSGCTMVTIPLIIVFLMFQDKFLSSVTLGAVKG